MSLMLLGILNAQAAGGAAAGAYDLLETQILAGTAASVTFSSIPQDYKHLQLRATGRNSFTNAGLRNLTVRFNSDSGTNYRGHILQGNGASVTSGDTGATTAVRMQQMLPDNDFAANIFGAGVMDILDYSSATKNTTTRALGGATGSLNRISLTSGVWINTDAVTSMDVSFDTFNGLAGTRLSIYGIRG